MQTGIDDLRSAFHSQRGSVKRTENGTNIQSNV